MVACRADVSKLFIDPFDPLSAERRRHKWIREVLRLPRDLVALELHDAHCVGRLAVIGQDQLGDPKPTAANDSLDGEPLLVRLAGALVLYVAPAAGSLARLRVVQHRVLVVDTVLRFEIARIGRRPMLIQCRTDRLISHSGTLLRGLTVVHVEPSMR